MRCWPLKKVTFKICKDSKDIGESCIKGNDGKLCFTNGEKKTGKERYKNLLNVGFSWPNHELPIVRLAEGPAPSIRKTSVAVTIQWMNKKKASGPSGIVCGMLKTSLDRSSEQIAHLMNAIIKENKIPSNGNDS